MASIFPSIINVIVYLNRYLSIFLFVVHKFKIHIAPEDNTFELYYYARFSGTLPDVLATANFQEDCSIELALLKAHQPDKPLMVMEYWTGWFDHYTENHHERVVGKFDAVLEDILTWNSSFNLYMMHGGTNWGFLNGGNIYGTGDDNSGKIFVFQLINDVRFIRF